MLLLASSSMVRTAVWVKMASMALSGSSPSSFLAVFLPAFFVAAFFRAGLRCPPRVSLPRRLDCCPRPSRLCCPAFWPRCFDDGLSSSPPVKRDTIDAIKPFFFSSFSGSV